MKAELKCWRGEILSFFCHHFERPGVIAKDGAVSPFDQVREAKNKFSKLCHDATVMPHPQGADKEPLSLVATEDLARLVELALRGLGRKGRPVDLVLARLSEAGGPSNAPL